MAGFNLTDAEKQELRDLARKRILSAQKSGDQKGELEAFEILRALEPIPKMMADTGKSIPTREQVPGLIGGEFRDPTLMEKFFNTSLERPGPTNKDIFPVAASMLGTTAAPLKFAGQNIITKMTAPFIRNAPKIAGAGAGGGAGEAAVFAADNPDASLLDILAAGGEAAKDYAALEAGGIGLGSAANKAFSKMIGKRIAPEGALTFAKETKSPLPLSTIQSGGGAQLEKASDLTFFGNMIRRNAADKINTSIQRTVDELTPNAKTPYEVAPQAQQVLKSVLEGAKDAKDVAYKNFETTIGKKTVVNDSLIKDAITEALDKAKAQGKSAGLVELKTFRNFNGARTFEDLERFRKDTLNGILGSSKTKEIGQIIDDAYKETYRQLGIKNGFDLNKSIIEANNLVKNLSALKDVPKLTDFANRMTSEPGWIVSFINPNNKQALKIIKEEAPEIYDSLIQQRIAISFFDKNKTYSPDGFVKFVKQNDSFIYDVYGAETAKVLNNFADYINTTEKFTTKVSQSDAIDKMSRLAFSGGIAGSSGSLPLGLATEASGSALSYLLTNPNTFLYKVFSETDPIKVGQMLETTGQLAPLTARDQINGQ